VLASGKEVWGDPYTEGSQIAKSGADEQEWHMSMFIWVSNHIIAKPNEYQKNKHVDAAGIGGRKMLLPGDISAVMVKRA